MATTNTTDMLRYGDEMYKSATELYSMIDSLATEANNIQSETDKLKNYNGMWLEGSDRECTDNLLGGEIKLHMEFNSEFIEVEDKKE